MIKTDIAIVGGGPAGMCAAIEAAKLGASVSIFERSGNLGGQLIKQTHMFFGSEKQYASYRGMDISEILTKQINDLPNIKVYTNATVLGSYQDDGVINVEHNDKYIKVKPSSTIIACGASEKFLSFNGNDLVGVVGAGAIQTLMNVYGIKPSQQVVMVGAGNIGLIVSYQLMQAGVKVKCIIDASSNVGSYLVHAAKIARMGVPIYLSTTVKAAHGKEKVERVTLVNVDSNYNPIPNSEFDIECDCLCISVGLSPLSELLWQMNCQMKYVPSLGGHVALRKQTLETSVNNVYIAGDVAGVEEASAAMVEGRIAGINCAVKLGFTSLDTPSRLSSYYDELISLRSGHASDKIIAGLKQVILEEK